MNVRSVGGISARLLKDPHLLTLIDHDKLCICSLAGLAADDVNHSDGNIVSNEEALNSWQTSLSWHKYLGDYHMLKPHLHFISQYLILDRRSYMKSCQELLYTFFKDDEILPVLVTMKEMLDTHQSVTGKQINTMLDGTPLLDWRLEKWNTMFFSRQQKMYPAAVR